MGTSYSQPFDRKVIESFGIATLTGEACAYSMRLLCDVNQDGVELINKAFGMTLSIHTDTDYAGNAITSGMMRRHNSQVNGKRSVASIMLSWTMIEELIRFGIVEKHLELGEIVISATPKKQPEGYTVNAFMWGGTQEEFEERFPDTDDYIQRNWNFHRYSIYGKQPRRGSMNVHAMSGRAP